MIIYMDSIRDCAGANLVQWSFIRERNLLAGHIIKFGNTQLI